MNLNRYDVVSVLAEAKKVTSGKTFTVEEFASAIGSMIQNRTNAPYLEWSKDGVECCVLQPGSQSWVKGKARVSLEFIPDEDEIEEEEKEVMERQNEKTTQNLLPSCLLTDLIEKLNIEQ